MLYASMANAAGWRRPPRRASYDVMAVWGPRMHTCVQGGGLLRRRSQSAPLAQLHGQLLYSALYSAVAVPLYIHTGRLASLQLHAGEIAFNQAQLCEEGQRRRLPTLRVRCLAAIATAQG